MAMPLIYSVDKQEFGLDRSRISRRIVEDNGGVPAWLEKCFEYVLAKTPAEFIFARDGGIGASILLECAEMLKWDYVDDGEWSRLVFHNIGMEVLILRETNTPDHDLARISMVGSG